MQVWEPALLTARRRIPTGYGTFQGNLSLRPHMSGLPTPQFWGGPRGGCLGFGNRSSRMRESPRGSERRDKADREGMLLSVGVPRRTTAAPSKLGARIPAKGRRRRSGYSLGSALQSSVVRDGSDGAQSPVPSAAEPKPHQRSTGAGMWPDPLSSLSGHCPMRYSA